MTDSNTTSETKSSNGSIERSLYRTLFWGLGISFFLVFAGVSTYSYYNLNNLLTKGLDVISRVTAENLNTPLKERDRDITDQRIEYLSNFKNIRNVCVYDNSGALFEHFTKDATVKACPEILTEQSFSENSYFSNDLVTKATVKDNNGSHGNLVIVWNKAIIYSSMVHLIVAFIIIVISSSALAYLMIKKVNNHIISPLLTLSKLAKRISKEKDFTLRSDISSDNEIRDLSDSFNMLMQTIHQSQLDMTEMMLQLEKKSRLLETHAAVAEEQNRTIRSMFVASNHDLRQPLQAIRLFANHVKQDSSGDISQIAQKIDSGITNLEQMIDETLDLSKLESKLYNIDKEDLKADEIISNLVDEFSEAAKKKGIELRFRSADINVYSNKSLLERILRNLISNAIRYTENGGVLITCRRRNEGTVIAIYDTGIGIEEQDLEKIYQAFFRAKTDRNVTTPNLGHGIGLTIVKCLTDALKYEVKLQSRHGKGSVFKILIPDATRTQK